MAAHKALPRLINEPASCGSDKNSSRDSCSTGNSSSLLPGVPRSDTVSAGNPPLSTIRSCILLSNLMAWLAVNDCFTAVTASATTRASSVSWCWVVPDRLASGDCRFGYCLTLPDQLVVPVVPVVIIQNAKKKVCCMQAGRVLEFEQLCITPLVSPSAWMGAP